MQELKEKAKELLESKKADVIFGYARGTGDNAATPVFITKPEDTEQLIFDPFCYNNLATYLYRDDHKRLGKPAMVAKDADMRAVIVLVQESQVEADGVLLLSVSCDETGNAAAGCRFNGVMTVAEAAKWLDEKYPEKDIAAGRMKQVADIEALGDADRWDFWREELSRCIRCYACRQACPLCYCKQCIVEKNQPQWVLTGIHPAGAFAWNIVRAFHLAGRCIDCGECERACPMDIPLTALNRKLAKVVRNAFEYTPGFDPDTKPVMANFKHDDGQEFFK